MGGDAENRSRRRVVPECSREGALAVPGVVNAAFEAKLGTSYRHTDLIKQPLL